MKKFKLDDDLIEIIGLMPKNDQSNRRISQNNAEKKSTHHYTALQQEHTVVDIEWTDSDGECQPISKRKCIGEQGQWKHWGSPIL